MLLGWSMVLFNKCKPEKTLIPKLFFVVALAIATPFICQALHVPEAKYVFIIFFGY